VDFRDVYTAELPYVWSTLRRLGVPPRELEDLAHDVFLVVHRRLREYDPSRPIRPWLFGIAFRIVSDYRRSARASREVLEDTPEATDRAPSADDQVAAAEARALVLQALAGLDLDRRAIFVLHDIDEVPVPEIASYLAIPLNTAYSRLRLAREDFSMRVKQLRGERASGG
jgi:RNA polymerase sigma-70 factor (ECF subfamily)